SLRTWLPPYRERRASSLSDRAVSHFSWLVFQLFPRQTHPVQRRACKLQLVRLLSDAIPERHSKGPISKALEAAPNHSCRAPEKRLPRNVTRHFQTDKHQFHSPHHRVVSIEKARRRKDAASGQYVRRRTKTTRAGRQAKRLRLFP